ILLECLMPLDPPALHHPSPSIPLPPSTFPDFCMSLPGCSYFSMCQDVLHQALSCSHPSHQTANSLPPSTFPDFGMSLPGCLYTSMCQDVLHQTPSCSLPSH